MIFTLLFFQILKYCVIFNFFFLHLNNGKILVLILFGKFFHVTCIKLIKFKVNRSTMGSINKEMELRYRRLWDMFCKEQLHLSRPILLRLKTYEGFILSRAFFVWMFPLTEKLERGGGGLLLLLCVLYL